MTRETVREILRKQRVQLGLNTRDIAEKTFINEAYIIAIEVSQYDRIRDPVYVKGFIRNYAQAVCLDPDMLIQYYNEETSAEKIRIPFATTFSKERQKTLRKSIEVVTRKTNKREGRMSKVEKAIIGALGILAIIWWIRFFYS